jgi:hypothetical protein
MMTQGRSGRRRAGLAALALTGLLALPAARAVAQNGALNTIPADQGYGAANAGGTGKLPPGAPANRGLPESALQPEQLPPGLPGAINTIPEDQGYGAANAHGTGKVPAGPADEEGGDLSVLRQVGKPGIGSVAGPGGAPPGANAGRRREDVETGGTEGAGSH